MLTTGNQLKAARALAGLDQKALATSAGINVNTVSKMEKRGDQMLTSGLDTVAAVMRTLEGAGVEFLNQGGLGVKLIEKDVVANQTAAPKITVKTRAAIAQ
jgi:transcriptional regulator with XRE-family HTH domain